VTAFQNIEKVASKTLFGNLGKDEQACHLAAP